MGITRIAAMVLILVLTSGQALAAACATTCAMPGTQMDLSMGDMDMEGMDMENCHQAKPAKDDHSKSHQTCHMAGCHLAQAAPFESALSNHFPALADSQLPHIYPSARSAELAPPIKPPA